MPYYFIHKNSLAIAIFLHILFFLLFLSLFTPSKEKEKLAPKPLHLCMLECEKHKETSQPTPPKPLTKEQVQKPKKSFKQEVPKKELTIQESTLSVPIEELNKKPQEPIQEPETAPKTPKKESFTEEKSLPLQQNEAIIQESQEIQEVSQEEQSQEFIEANFSIIRDMALKNLVYPKIARKRGWSGTTTIELQIATDGKLIKAFVTHSSGREALDNAALKSVLALKGKALPKPKTVTKISLPIRFSLK